MVGVVVVVVVVVVVWVSGGVSEWGVCTAPPFPALHHCHVPTCSAGASADPESPSTLAWVFLWLVASDMVVWVGWLVGGLWKEGR